MAISETPVQDPSAEVNETSAENGAATPAKAKKERTGMYVPTPAVLRDRIATEAEAAGKSPRVYVRDLLAAQYGLTLPPAVTRTKYGSADEKKEALVARRKSRADLIKALLAEHRAKTETPATA